MQSDIKSRAIGILFWAAFLATSLIVVLFTFVAALDDHDTGHLAGHEAPEPQATVPPLETNPLCFGVSADETDADAMRAIDARAAERGFRALGTWQRVEPSAALPFDASRCGFVVVLDARSAPTPTGPHARCAGRQLTVPACRAQPRNESSVVFARLFDDPEVEAEALERASVPELVYFAQAAVARGLGMSPFVATPYITEVALDPSHTALTPATGLSRCVAWTAVVTHEAGRIVDGGLSPSDCGSPTALVVAGARDATSVWLRPHVRAEGPHVAQAHEGERAPFVPFARVLEGDLEALLARSP